MKSKLAGAIGLASHPLALTWADGAPAGALQFKTGTWGCVVSLLAAVATKGKTAAFHRESYGCWGGGVGLGFGNQYETFPGGVEGFCGFLAHGNDHTETGRRIGEQLASGPGARLADDFQRGERYTQTPEGTKRFLDSMPMRDIGQTYVVAKPLHLVDPETEEVKSVTFFVEPDALSALVILANYSRPEIENVIIPWAAGCQIMGIYGYRELDRPQPRALVGMTDISARHNVRAQFGKNIMSFTMPWPLFLEMEKNSENCFLQRETWKALHEQRP